MNDVLSAIEQHLHRKLTPAQLDYYQVIGLQPFCNDTEEIQVAIQKANESLPTNPTNNPSPSEALVAKLIRQAQSVLLDPRKKIAYDQQLKKLFEAKRDPQAHSSRPEPNADRLLPPGDPMQPFSPQNHSPSQWIASSSPNDILEFPIPNPKARRDELLELFPSLLTLANKPSSNQTPSAPAWANQNSFNSKTSSTTSNSNPTPVPKPTVTASSLAEELRKRRQRSNLLMVGGMILFACILLGFAGFQFVRNRQQIAKQDKATPPRAPLPQTNTPELQIGNVGKTNRPNNQSNLPELPPVNRNANPSEVMPSPENKKPKTDEPMAIDNAPVSSQPNPTPESTPESESTPEPETTPEPSKPAMTKESSQWVEAIKNARGALDKGDLNAFKKLIPSAIESAQTPSGKEKALRLDQLGQLYGIFTESFEEAKRKTKGTSSLKVGNSEVSIVESTPEKLIVRASGKNQTYNWNELPFGLAVAISDLGLDPNAPVDVAARAVYFSVNENYKEASKSNEIIAKRIAGWFEKSQGKESIRPDLKQALEDSYE